MFQLLKKEKNNMRFIGDIHAQWDGYKNLIANCDYTIQVGDFGLGFPGHDFPAKMLSVPGCHRFIRGNHDKVQVCKNHPWYLGDFGYFPEFGDIPCGIFFLGGAWTPDFYNKVEGINWWRDEELNYTALEKAIFMAIKEKPKIIVTHDCPRELKDNHLGRHRYIDNNGGRYENTRTDNALQVLFEQHQPDLWIFGHYHERQKIHLNGTEFICLEEFGVFDL